MRSLLTLFFVVEVFSQGAVAQSSSQRPTIALGMSGYDVRKLLGTPQIYRNATAQQYLYSERVGVIPPSSVYQDIYGLKTPLSAYELRIEYGLDNSESRLNPVPRVAVFQFRPDKPINIADVGMLLHDISEAVRLCEGGCTVSGQTQVIGGRDSIYLHPQSLSPTHLKEAEWIGTFFGEFRNSEIARGKTFKPTITVSFEKTLIESIRFAMETGFFEGPVQDIWRPSHTAEDKVNRHPIMDRILEQLGFKPTNE